MELIVNNPYRIAGILSNASERELQKQKTKIKAYTKVGKEFLSDYDFNFLSSIKRTEDSVDKAFSNVEQNQDKVNYALFWFLNISPFDNTAIEYLKNGDESKAEEIWEKVTLNKEVSSKNFSAFNNLGTIRLLSKTQHGIQEGIEAKIKLIESEFFENFVHSVADETFTIDKEKQIEKLIDELLVQFKNQFSGFETTQLFSKTNGITQKYLYKKLTDQPLHNIEGQIEITKQKRKEDKLYAYSFGLNLFTNSKDDLALLKSLLGTDNLKYKSIADQLSNEILQCGIDCFNSNEENDIYLEAAQKLTKIADSIAVGKLTKDRVKDSILSLAEIKERHLIRAIELLKSVKSAYETNKVEITNQVRAMPLGYNQSIDWTKVNEMIENSIDWNKVVELVKEVIPPTSIEKIKNSDKLNKISDYKALVDFMLSKLNYLQLNQVKYLCYWKTVSKSPLPNKTSKPSSGGGGCYIATMVYGYYDHPQVLVLRGFRDNLLSKTILGRSFIKYYYHFSPRMVEKLKNKQRFNLLIRNFLDLLIKIIK